LSENKPSGKPASKPACRGLFSQLGLSLLNFNRKSKIGKSLNETPRALYQEKFGQKIGFELEMSFATI
jgi:hypothetical protein